MKNTIKKIHIDDEESCKYVKNIEGWVSSNGRFYGFNKELAKYDGCTHISCKICGIHISKNGRTICKDCLDKKRFEEFKNLQKEKWDGECLIYSDVNDKFYDSVQEAQEDLEDNETLEDLHLLLCEPKSPSISEDLFEEFILDETPSTLLSAIETFNNSVMSVRVWYPTKKALDLEKYKEEQNR